jgi:CBS domain-containing protein
MWAEKKEDVVRAFMTKGVLTVDENDTVLEAARLMAELDIGSLIVVRDGVPVGILTERDILSKVVAEERSAKSLKISEVMSSPVISVQADRTVSEALTLMGQKGIKHLVVKDGSDVVGMFSLANVVDLEKYRLGIV